MISGPHVGGGVRVERTASFERVDHRGGRAIVLVIGHVIAKLQKAGRKINVEHSARSVFNVDLTNSQAGRSRVLESGTHSLGLACKYLWIDVSGTFVDDPACLQLDFAAKRD